MAKFCQGGTHLAVTVNSICWMVIKVSVQLIGNEVPFGSRPMALCQVTSELAVGLPDRTIPVTA